MEGFAFLIEDTSYMSGISAKTWEQIGSVYKPTQSSKTLDPILQSQGEKRSEILHIENSSARTNNFLNFSKQQIPRNFLILACQTKLTLAPSSVSLWRNI